MNMNSYARIFFLISLILYPCLSAPQEDKPAIEKEVIKPGFKPLPVLIAAPFLDNPEAASVAEELQKTLSNDLYNSDYFEIVDASPYPPFRGEVNLNSYKASRAKYVALLKVGQSGEQINVEARFYDLQSEQLIVGKVYRWERKVV